MQTDDVSSGMALSFLVVDTLAFATFLALAVFRVLLRFLLIERGTRSVIFNILVDFELKI